MVLRTNYRRMSNLRITCLQLPPDLVHVLRAGADVTIDFNNGDILFSSNNHTWTAPLRPSVGASSVIHRDGVVESVTHMADNFTCKPEFNSRELRQKDQLVSVSGEVKAALARLLFQEADGLSVEEVLQHLTSKFSRSDVISGIREHCVQLKSKHVVFKEHLLDGSSRVAERNATMQPKQAGSNVLSGFFSYDQNSPDRTEELDEASNAQAAEAPTMSRPPRTEREVPKSLSDIDLDESKLIDMRHRMEALQQAVTSAINAMTFDESKGILTLKDYRHWCQTYAKAADSITESRKVLLAFENAAATGNDWLSGPQSKQCVVIAHQLSALLTEAVPHARSLDSIVAKLQPRAESVFAHLTLFRDLCSADVLTVN